MHTNLYHLGSKPVRQRGILIFFYCIGHIIANWLLYSFFENVINRHAGLSNADDNQVFKMILP